MSLAANLRREMDARAIDAAELEGRTGIRKSFIAKYLSGKTKPADDVIERLASGLGCDPADLIRARMNRTRGKIYPEDAARMLHRNAQDIRYGLRMGVLPFGRAYKRPGSSVYTYEIDPLKLNAYVAAQKEIWASMAQTNT